MTDAHNYSFFGQKVGLTVQTSSKNEPYLFFRLIKSKGDGSWEKPSSGEGKTIKFSLEEIVCIIRVLKKEIPSWSSFHTYKNIKTQISFRWEEGESGKLWIHIGAYSKILDYAQLKILEMLLNHILKEKIEFSTTNLSFNKRFSGNQNNIVTQEEFTSEKINLADIDNNEIANRVTIDKLETSKKTNELKGSIKGETEKALLIQLENKSELWIPKSTIHSRFDNTKNIVQNFLIDSWILKKNKSVS
jgi:hypothetical protein